MSTVFIIVYQRGIPGQDAPGFLTPWRWCHFLLQQKAGKVSRSARISAPSTETLPLSKYLSESACYTAPAFNQPFPTISTHSASSTLSRFDKSKTSPEMKEMIHVGDTVLEINGISVQNIPLDEVRYYIQNVIFHTVLLSFFVLIGQKYLLKTGRLRE